MKKKISNPNILFVAGPNSRYKLPKSSPAGFWAGLWHGMIAGLVFVVGLFTTDVKIYETNNNGRWYDFGFILGAGILGGGTKKANCW